MKPVIFHIVLGIICSTAVILNGWAIYRGTIFQADLIIPGLQLQHGSLAFTPTLIGQYHFNPLLDNVALSGMYIFESTKAFPVPNLNDLVYQNAQVLAHVDDPQYTSRCLRLNSLIPFNLTSAQPVFLYDNTMMDATGRGVQGNICQLLFHDPAAYPSFDRVCYSASNGNYTGLACLRNSYLLNCLSLHDLQAYTVSNCGAINSAKKNIHYSGKADGETSGWLTLDPDQNQELDWNQTII